MSGKRRIFYMFLFVVFLFALVIRENGRNHSPGGEAHCGRLGFEVWK